MRRRKCTRLSPRARTLWESVLESLHCARVRLETTLEREIVRPTRPTGKTFPRSFRFECGSTPKVRRLALGAGTWSAAHVSDGTNSFFLSGFHGAVLFTSVSMAVLWQRRLEEVTRGLATRKPRSDDWLFWVRIIGLFLLFTAVPDLIRSVLLATSRVPNSAYLYVILVFVAINMCAATFFVARDAGANTTNSNVGFLDQSGCGRPGVSGCTSVSSF